MSLVYRFAARVALLITLALVAAALPESAAGQAVPQLPPGITQSQILDRLRRSGLTREQVRAQLDQLGYDASLADVYFDQLEGRGGGTSGTDVQFADALSDMGLLTEGVPGQAVPFNSSQAGSPVAAYAQGLDDTDSIRTDSSRVFGRDLFTRSRTQFDPIMTGPIDPSYPIGPGDQLFLVLTGDVEAAYTLQVTRDGYAVIPDVG
jgi:hypothetical protein